MSEIVDSLNCFKSGGEVSENLERMETSEKHEERMWRKGVKQVWKVWVRMTSYLSTESVVGSLELMRAIVVILFNLQK